MRGEQRYTIEALASHTGFTPRTIRSYVERRIIPPATGRGGGPALAGIGWYTQDHIRKLLQVRALMDQRMTLDDIRERINPVEDE